MKRSYELKERARRQEETRQRIVEATVELHREVGPARTTVADVARRAGVSRVTVYNHFPDERELLGACSASFIAAHPPPDPRTWTGITDPAQRLRRALREQVAWFRANEAMLANVGRDARLMPALAEVIAQGAAPAEAAMKDVLLAGRALPAARRAKAAAALGLALSFESWQHLARREGLGDEAAIDVLAGAVEAAATA